MQRNSEFTAGKRLPDRYRSDASHGGVLDPALYDILRGHDFRVVLVNAHHTSQRLGSEVRNR
jgi:hypothetical protein